MCRALAASAVPCPSSYACVALTARAMLRQARDAEWRRIAIEMPYLPPGFDLSAPLQPEDYSRWPGGLQQRQRVGLVPMVDAMLEGYDPEFLGLIDVGMGVWSFANGRCTAVSHVSDLTFSQFDRLCSGFYGSRPTRPDHTLLLVNPRFSCAANVGQPWDRQLRKRATKLLDEGGWRMAFLAMPLGDGGGIRGSGGALVGTLIASEMWHGTALCTPECMCLYQGDKWDEFSDGFQGTARPAQALQLLRDQTNNKDNEAATSGPTAE